MKSTRGRKARSRPRATVLLGALAVVVAQCVNGMPVVKAGAIPVTPVPPGYGHYCSTRHGSTGWAFGALDSVSSDPCGDLLRKSPNGSIQRAGLWSTTGGNNVLVRCAQGLVGLFRGTGSTPLDDAYDAVTGKHTCTFTVAPTHLPVFGLPYGRTPGPTSDFPPSFDVRVSNGFDYDSPYRVGMDVTDFGQTPRPGHPLAHSVDRLGRERDQFRSDGTEHWEGREPAYDWPMPKGKELTAVAPGLVVGARERDTSAFNCGPDNQQEIYVLHTVGEGTYAERFVSYYAHSSKMSVNAGDKVTRGQKIGEAGDTGCATGIHLHLGVFRLTNLTGFRKYRFALRDTGGGTNGLQGIIDPFGWGAPKGIDPRATRFLGVQPDANGFPGVTSGTVKDPGAFSIRLWLSEEQSPPYDY